MTGDPGKEIHKSPEMFPSGRSLLHFVTVSSTKTHSVIKEGNWEQSRRQHVQDGYQTVTSGHQHI